MSLTQLQMVTRKKDMTNSMTNGITKDMEEGTYLERSHSNLTRKDNPKELGISAASN